MKVWLRWLKIIFTCGLGNHLDNEVIGGGEHIAFDCPRCHRRFVQDKRERKGYFVFTPPTWEVAQGKWDREWE